MAQRSTRTIPTIRSTTACACGRTARYAGRRPKTFTSVLGPLTNAPTTTATPVARAAARGLRPARHVAVARRAADGGAVGVRLQLRRGQRPVVGTRGAVETKQVEGAAEALGREARRRTRCGRNRPQGCTWGWTAPVCRRPAEVEGRRGKQPDGSPETRRWRGRPKGATRRAGPCATAGRSATTPRSRARPAATPTRCANVPIARRNGAADTAARPSRHRRRRPLDLARRRRAVSRRHRNRRHLPRQAASVRRGQGHYGAGTDLADRWARDRRAELDAGQAQRCASMAARSAKVHSLCVLLSVPRQGPVRLVGRRRGRMQADRRPAQAAGTPSPAPAIIALRCLLSGRFEDFWERRAAA